jgi:[ribosomal protein S5]-alanine N-acetyltransferase
MIETIRLVFKKFKEEDFADYFSLVGNEDVMKMISGNALSRDEALLKFEKILSTGKANPETGYYSIRIKETNAFIGLGKIVMTGKREAEIGYALLPESWNQGFGSEISVELVKYAKSINYIDSLIAIIDPENLASKRILAKSKFKLYRVCEIDHLPAEIYKLKFGK